MNWRKRKKLRKIAHAHGKSHYYEWRDVIKGICHLDLYIRYCKEGCSEAWRVLVYGKSAYEAMRLPGGEHCKYPTQTLVDLHKIPDVTTKAGNGGN